MKCPRCQHENPAAPLVVVFEDLHWIDSETQTLLDSLVESLPAARLLLLVNYRPEYSHAWSGKTYYRQLRIDPLPPESADELLDALIGSPEGRRGRYTPACVSMRPVSALIKCSAAPGACGARRPRSPQAVGVRV